MIKKNFSNRIDNDYVMVPIKHKHLLLPLSPCPCHSFNYLAKNCELYLDNPNQISFLLISLCFAI